MNPQPHTLRTNPLIPSARRSLTLRPPFLHCANQCKGRSPPVGKPPQPHLPKHPLHRERPSNPPPPTYASKTSVRARPSVVVDLEKHQIADRPHPSVICSAINKGLKTYPDVCQARVSAARWTVRGNLVITAGPNTSEKLLNSAILYIALITKKALKLQINASTPTRANVRWSRILINCMPTGATAKTEAHNPVSCHQSLMADNPSYASLTITQHPSWVKPPSSYTLGSVSSLSFAFEDPDGSLATKLLSEKELYIFGTGVSVKKWKQKPPQKKPMAQPEQTTLQNNNDLRPAEVQVPSGTRQSRRRERVG